MFTTKLTSQGTITLPIELRRKFNLQVGETLIVGDSGMITISRPLDLSTVRAKNKIRLYGRGKTVHIYRNGEGFEAHVTEKYGKK